MVEKGIELVEEISNIEFYICGHEVDDRTSLEVFDGCASHDFSNSTPVSLLAFGFSCNSRCTEKVAWM